MTAVLSVTTTQTNDIFAQTAIKGIVIGPDSSKDGDDVYNPTEIIVNTGDKVIWINKDFGIRNSHCDRESGIVCF